MSAPLCKKVLIVGNRNCGKTSIKLVLMQNQVLKGHNPRLGKDSIVHLDIFVERKKELELLIKEKDSKEHSPEYTTDSDVILVCYSTESLESLESITSTWSPVMKSLCPDVPILVVCNKTDLGDEELVKIWAEALGEGQAVADEIGASAYLECSTKLNEGIKEVLQALIGQPLLKKKVKKKENNAFCNR